MRTFRETYLAEDMLATLQRRTKHHRAIVSRSQRLAKFLKAKEKARKPLP